MFSNTSNFNEGVDLAFAVILGISVIFLVGITAVMIYFVVKYNKKRNPKPTDIKDNTKLEILWTVVPTLLVLVMFYYGWVGYAPMRNIPDDNIPVKVTGRMWSWSFEYENGKVSNDLVVPKGKAIKLDLYSPDVLHSFYIPAFRIKEDVVPGINNKMWFQANEIGEYDIFCAEYCGERHAYMLSKCKVVSEEEYSDWLADLDSDGVTVKKGIKILNDNGCFACHTENGEKQIGPSFKGIFEPKNIMTNGKTEEINPDADYIIRSIYEPEAETVEGYASNMMVSFKAAINEDDMKSVLQYLYDLNGMESAPQKDGFSILKKNSCVACHTSDGSRLIGPSFKGIYNQKNVVIDGKTQTITPDDNYMIRAIYEPNAEIVESYAPNMMVSYKEAINEEDMQLIIEYLKELNK